MKKQVYERQTTSMVSVTTTGQGYTNRVDVSLSWVNGGLRLDWDLWHKSEQDTWTRVAASFAGAVSASVIRVSPETKRQLRKAAQLLLDHVSEEFESSMEMAVQLEKSFKG